MIARQCSRTACNKPAVATLTYVHADQTAVLGPLAIHAEPHTYDLCANHGVRLTAPRGWRLVRLDVDLTEPATNASDDLLALADAVRAQPAASVADATVRPVSVTPGAPRLTVVPRG